MTSRIRRYLPAFLLALCAMQAEAAPERYVIDPQHTFASFEYEHWGLSLQRGRLDETEGSIVLDPLARTGVVEIRIAAASISTGSTMFDAILRSPDFFDTDAHPAIIFRSSQLHFDGDRLASVDGELTIKGITRGITLQLDRFNCRFMLTYGKRACGANGSVRLLRSDYELGRYVPFVSDAVTLYVTVEAIREETQNTTPGG